MHAIYAKVLEVLIPQDYHLRKKSSLNVSMRLPAEGTKQSIPMIGHKAFHTKSFFAMNSSYSRFGTMVFKVRETKYAISKVIASLRLELRLFPKDTVVTSWFSMETEHSPTPVFIQLKIHISSNSQMRPFNAPSSNSIMQLGSWETPFLALQQANQQSFENPAQNQNFIIPPTTEMCKSPSNERISLQDIPALYITSKPLISYNMGSTDHINFDL